MGKGGSQLYFLSVNRPGTIVNSSISTSFANLTIVDRVNLVLQSQLYLMNVNVTSTVICYNNDQGVNASVTFIVGKNSNEYPTAVTQQATTKDEHNKIGKLLYIACRLF